MVISATAGVLKLSPLTNLFCHFMFNKCLEAIIVSFTTNFKGSSSVQNDQTGVGPLQDVVKQNFTHKMFPEKVLKILSIQSSVTTKTLIL